MGTVYDQGAVYEFGVERAGAGREIPVTLLAVVGRLYALCELAAAHAGEQRVPVLEAEAAPLTLAAIDLVQWQEGFSEGVRAEAECLADFLYGLVQPAPDPAAVARLVAELA